MGSGEWIAGSEDSKAATRRHRGARGVSPEIMNQPVPPLNSRNAAASRSSGREPEIMNQPVAPLNSRNAAPSR